ncbi:hypothetical protein BDB01DRAFT_790044 [Pilobolus umbonatus]|nr:hypothetical protein BDB01DRAFT_790044 [Pilobolus umbonatus]
MPVPVEYIRRMSTVNAKHDIHFDTHEFQFCQPQNDIKSTFESRELEATFCRDFVCCGLILEDLHDLLQHYEECHVRLEEEEGYFFDDIESSSVWPPSNGSTVPSTPQFMTDDDEEEEEIIVNISMNQLKKKAAAYLSDLYNTPVIKKRKREDEGMKKKKQPSNAIDLLTQSAVKKIAQATACDRVNHDSSTTMLNDEEFLAQAGALLASSPSITHSTDKPYKCTREGCDKAYKNPNGLKYHNKRGHCNLPVNDCESIASKPYQCTIGDCGKRYKNLNGLKYHIDHSHMAAFHHTLSSFSSTLFPSTSILEDMSFL